MSFLSQLSLFWLAVAFVGIFTTVLARLLGLVVIEMSWDLTSQKEISS